MKPTETTSTGPEKLVLSSKSVCDIIESCARHKVVELKFQDLLISFSPQAERLPRPSGANTPVAEITDKQHSRQNREALTTDELRLRAEQLEELKITDPSLFEEMVRNGELLDDDSDDTDDGDDQSE
jgi:hypothetical protein